MTTVDTAVSDAESPADETLLSTLEQYRVWAEKPTGIQIPIIITVRCARELLGNICDEGMLKQKFDPVVEDIYSGTGAKLQRLASFISSVQRSLLETQEEAWL